MAETKKFDPAKKDHWADVEEVRKGFTTVKFENIGDSFVGIYRGEETITTDDGELIEAFTFDDLEGMPVGIWKSHDLTRKLEEVAEGSTVRIEYRSDVPTRRGQTPMKEFKVQYKY